MPQCARCRQEANREDHGFHAPLQRKLMDAEPTDCAWARLSDGQRNYLMERGVSPSRFCQLRQRATKEWLDKSKEESFLSDRLSEWRAYEVRA